MIMKTTIRTIALATLVAIASLSQTVIAQTGRTSTKVDVPFSFDYGTQHFAPGVYTVSMRDKNILTLSSGNRSAWAMIQTGYDPTQHGAGYVMFRKYGDRCFLTEYGPANGSIHASVFESGAERRAAREFAANHLNPDRVQLALMSTPSDGAQSK
jgi:hypothetical protein